MEPQKSGEEPIRSLYWSEKLKNTGYNVKYKALSYIEESSANNIVKNFQTAYMLGKCYQPNPDNHADVNKQLYDDFRMVPWMTYRSVFPEMSSDDGSKYISDTGWGCMVRVGQMMAAQSLIKHSKVKTKEEIKNILKLFDDFDNQQMFSIQNIVRMARQEYELEPGKWYNPSQISYILSDLFLAKKGPEWKNLKFFILNNATLFYDQIVFKMTGCKQLCKCKKQKLVCYKCYKQVSSLSLTLLARIGLESPEKKYLRVVNRMMEFKTFMGIIGGKPQKALYFLGRIGDNYIYLDPHTVQSGVNSKNFDQSLNSYFCTSFRSCRNTSIDPSIGVGFYLETLKDLDNLYEGMTKLKEQYPQDFFLFTSLETPEYMKPTKATKEEEEGETFVDISKKK